MRPWEKSTLGKHVDLLTGYPFKSGLYVENGPGISLLRGDNVVQGTIRWDDVKRYPEHLINGLEKFFLKEGDFLIAMDRTWVKAGLKAASIKEKDLPSLLVQRVARLRAKKTLDSYFLSLLIRTHRFEQYVKGVQTETAVPHISAEQIREFSFLLPPLRDQKAVASFIRTWDTAIEKTERLIAAKEERYRWLLLEMINNGCEKNGWEKARLGEIFAEVTRKVGEKDVAPFSISAGIGFVSQKEKWGRDIAG